MAALECWVLVIFVGLIVGPFFFRFVSAGRCRAASILPAARSPPARFKNLLILPLKAMFGDAYIWRIAKFIPGINIIAFGNR